MFYNQNLHTETHTDRGRVNMGSLKNEDDVVEGSKDAVLYVNGVRKVLPDGLAHLTLLEYLRGTITNLIIIIIIIMDKCFRKR